MIQLTRRYPFSASHRLHSAALTEQENARIFGKCNNPFGHGHNYLLSVTVAGPIDPNTGLVIDIRALDELVETHVVRAFAYRNLNQDVPQFRSLIPTTENVAVVICGLIEDQWAARFGDQLEVALVRIHVQETERNGFELDVRARHSGPVLLRKRESVEIDV